MPTLGNALDFSKYEAKQMRAHQLGAAPSSPVTGQVFYNTADNTLYWWDGSAWVSARGGASTTPPATTGALGTIQLAGDLAGTATSPQIKAASIVYADFAAELTDGDQAKPQPRYLSNGGNPAHALPADTTMATMQPPASDVNLNNHQIYSVAAPASPTNVATKGYVDNIAQGLDPKASVRVATTGNVNVNMTPLVVDGITVVSFDRVLVKDQTTPAQNGIYLVSDPGSGSNGQWLRVTDMDAWTEVPGSFTFVEQGTTQADTGWVCTADQGGTLGTTAMPWVQFSGAGQITGGAGLTKTGNTLDVGQGNGLSVLADTVNIASGGITDGMIAAGNLDPNKLMSAVPVSKGGTGATDASAARTALGAGNNRVYTINKPPSGSATLTVPFSEHDCDNGRGNVVQVLDNVSGAVEFPDIVIAANGDVTITYGASVTANSKRVTVMGLA